VVWTVIKVIKITRGGMLFRIQFLLTPIVFATFSGKAITQEISEEKLKAKAKERNKVYAPWNPANIEKRRKEMGMIGPGPQKPYSQVRFPDYLKKPNTIDEMMSQALLYGSPDELLRLDWVQEIPSITVTGTYNDYAADPGAYWIKWANGISDGTNKYLSN
jgi:hypothetical protein